MQLSSSPSLSVSRETEVRLATLVSLVVEWNSSTRLVSGRDVSLLANRHVADSLTLLPLLGDARDIADLGSGAGFPGLVLAIASGRPITLVEADQRKAAFLREAARVTSAPAIVHAGRMQAVRSDFDLITARAVAPLATLLGLVSPRLRHGGRALFPKGQAYKAEIEQAELLWHFQLREHRSSTSDASRILEVTDIAAKSGR